MPPWLAEILERLLDFIPVQRWVRAIRNVLTALSEAFILIWILLAALIVNDWGFSAGQRLSLIGVLLVFQLLLIAVVVILAMQGEALFSPYERSLRRGRRYGTERRPRRKAEVEALPPETERPGLPPPETETRQLPRGKS